MSMSRGVAKKLGQAEVNQRYLAQFTNACYEVCRFDISMGVALYYIATECQP